MKALHSLIVAALCFAMAFGQQNVPEPKQSQQVAEFAPQDTLPPSKARISFDSERFDFGFAPQGEGFLVHAFKVTNIGEDTFHITGVRPTCGCTAAPLRKDKLAPKETTEIAAIFNLRGYKTATSKSIRVESNDPTHRNVSLMFSANMDTAAWHNTSQGPRIIPEPDIIDLGKGDLFKRESKFSLKNIGEKSIEARVIDYTRDVLKEPKITGAKIGPGKTATVDIHLLDSADPNTEVKASITFIGVDESGSEATRFTVPITGGGR